MKRTMLYSGICATVAMLVGASAYAVDKITIGTFKVIHGHDGKDGTSVKIKGSVATCSALPNNAEIGDIYMVVSEGNKGFIWDGTTWNCPNGGVTLQGPACPLSATWASAVDANNKDVIRVTLKNTCDNTTAGQVDIPKPEDPCEPEVTATPDDTARKTSVRFSCGSVNTTFDVPYGQDAPGRCDGLSAADSAVTEDSTTYSTYIDHTSNAPGYRTRTTKYCDGHAAVTYETDLCTSIHLAERDNCGPNAQLQECKNQMYPEDTSKKYNICLPIDTAGASSHSSAISAAQTDADNAQSTAATALSTAQTAESTAETALNTASNKISNTATFAFETIDGVEKLVLKDGDKTIVIANKADIKGDKGDKGEDGASPCPGGFETLLTSEDANESLYTVYCKQSN